jgi:hypothetical protein
MEEGNKYCPVYHGYKGMLMWEYLAGYTGVLRALRYKPL